VDETILLLLQERDVLASADLASALDIHERSVRRHLRRLIRGGYVFSPEYGRYRITALGVAALAPLPDVGRRVEAEAAVQPLVGVLSPTTTPAPTSPVDEPRHKLYARMRRRR
jgi:DNA-binding IclR family transcriptional regulator